MWYYYVKFNKTRKKWTVYRRWRPKKHCKKPGVWDRYTWKFTAGSYYEAIDSAVASNAIERKDWAFEEARGYYDRERHLEDEW